jgi:hypothetical protein
MTIKQRYEAYRAECAKTDTSAAILCEHTPREQELYSAWQAAIRDCPTWRDGDTTWYVLNRYQDGDLEMWTCRIVTPNNPQGEIADCYARAVREMAQPASEEEKPYTCHSCGARLDFPHTFFYGERAYCSEHLPEYQGQESEGW